MAKLKPTAKRKSKPARKQTKPSGAANYGLAEEAAPFIDAPPTVKNAQGQPLFKPADPTRTYDLTMTTVDARENFAELLNRVAFAKRRVVLTRRGKPFVAVIPMDDIEWIELIEDQLDVMAAERAQEEMEKNPGGSISLEDLAKKYGIKLQGQK